MSDFNAVQEVAEVGQIFLSTLRRSVSAPLLMRERIALHQCAESHIKAVRAQLRGSKKKFPGMTEFKRRKS